MAIIAGNTLHFNDLPPYIRETVELNKKNQPFMAEVARNGVKILRDKVFDMNQVWDVGTGAQDGLSENDVVTGAAASFVDRAIEQNAIQLFQRTVDMSYLRGSIQGGVSSDAGGDAVSGEAQISPLDFQIMAHLRKINADWGQSALNGTATTPTTSALPFQMGGVIPSISTYNVNAAAAAVSQALVDSVLIQMFDGGSPSDRVQVWCGATQKVALSKLYGLAERSFTSGGVAVDILRTDFGNLEIVMDTNIANDTIAFLDMEKIQMAVLPAEGSTDILVENKTTTGASNQRQMYWQSSVDFGAEGFHGKLSNLA